MWPQSEDHNKSVEPKEEKRINDQRKTKNGDVWDWEDLAPPNTIESLDQARTVNRPASETYWGQRANGLDNEGWKFPILEVLGS